MADRGLIFEIQVLRGIAVLMTFFHHASIAFPQFAPLAKINLGTGVDIFFAISGFVIARSFLPQLENASGTREWMRLSVGFWIKRFYRLAPASLFWGLLTLLAASLAISGSFGSTKVVLQEFYAAMLYSKNIMELYSPGAALGHFWSLSLEEQFYIMLPFIVLIFPRVLYPSIGLVLVLVLSVVPILYTPYYIFFRIQPILLGVLIYRLYQLDYSKELEPFFLRWFSSRFITYGFFVLVVIVFSPKLRNFQLSMLYLTISSGFVVYAASFNKGYLCGRTALTRFLSFLGNVSYSFYVCHLFILLLFHELYTNFSGGPITNMSSPMAIAALIGCCFFTLFVSYFSHKYLEAPFQRLGRSASARYSSSFDNRE